MEHFNNCPYCGTYLNNNYASSASAASMLAALTHANALPLVALLESWWSKLNETDKDQFVKALLWRAIKLIGSGDMDDRVKTVIENQVQWYDPEVFKKQLGELPSGKLVEALAKRVGERLAEGEDDYRMGQSIEEAFKGHVQNVTKRLMADQREVIESAVRQRQEGERVP